MAIERLNITKEAKDAAKVLNKARNDPFLKNPLSPDSRQIVQIRGNTRRGPWVGLGALIVLSLIGAGKLALDAVNKSSGLSDSARQLCDDIPSVANIVDDGCSVHVPSVVEVKPRNPDVTEGVKGTVEFVLSGETKAGKLTRGNGIGLSVPTEVIPSENYSDAFVSISDPTGEHVGAQELFAGYSDLVQSGGEIADMALAKCREEMDNLMSTVQSNAEFFATDTFTVEAIRQAIQRVDYAPYTATPYPDEDHLEIIFTKNGGELICPQPVSAA